jgi:hypothetical protein
MSLLLCAYPIKAGGKSALSAAVVIAALSAPGGVSAQDAESDAHDARLDAILATPGASTPAPQANLFATAPGLEQQALAPLFRFNFLAPFTYNSNAEETGAGTSTFELSPLANLSLAAPLSDLPLRLSASLNVESDRFLQSREADRDKIGGSLRFQYVDINNDQGFSPFFAYAPRVDFIPAFSHLSATRQDINLGINKRFNFSENLQQVPLAGNTGSSTILSFGLTMFGQRRFREPAPASYAFYFIPSVSYIFSEQWNASFAVEVIGRWFDANFSGFERRDWQAQPILTLEYVVPTAVFGAAKVADFFGRPALDLQTSFVRNWSNITFRNYTQWTASAVIKTGWRF